MTGRIKMILSKEWRVVAEDECIYGEYGEMVDKKLISTIEFPPVA